MGFPDDRAGSLLDVSRPISIPFEGASALLDDDKREGGG